MVTCWEDHASVVQVYAFENIVFFRQWVVQKYGAIVGERRAAMGETWDMVQYRLYLGFVNLDTD